MELDERIFINRTFKTYIGGSTMHRRTLIKKEEVLLKKSMPIFSEKSVNQIDLLSLNMNEVLRLYSVFYKDVFKRELSFPRSLLPTMPAADANLFPICMPVSYLISADITYVDKDDEKLLNLRTIHNNLNAELAAFGKIERSNRDLSGVSKYIVLTPLTFEADGELRSKSANDIANQRIRVLRFCELRILNLFIYWFTGLPLDRYSVTLTETYVNNASREVIGMGYDGTSITVDKYKPDLFGQSLYFRSAILQEKFCFSAS